MKTRQFFLVKLITISLLFTPFLSLGAETSFTLIYSSNTLGEVQPHCCPETGAVGTGGLGKRAHYIKTVREEVKNLLILDGGDAFIFDPPTSEKESEKSRKKAEFVLKLYEKMGYDALNMGDTDLSLGINYLKNLQKYSKMQFISSNLKDKKTKNPIFKPYLIKVANGSRIGIIGLLTPIVPPYWYKEMEGCFIEDPMKTAIEIINGPLHNCDHIIILAHLSSSEIESLANRISKTLIIIGGNDRSFIFPKKINQSIWVQTDPLGYRIGRMNLRLEKGSSEFVDVGARSKLQKNIEEIQKLIDNPQHGKEVKSLIKLRETLSEQKKNLPEAEGKNAYENHLTYLHQGMKSDAEIEELIAAHTND